MYSHPVTHEDVYEYSFFRANTLLECQYCIDKKRITDMYFIQMCEIEMFRTKLREMLVILNYLKIE